MDQEFFVRETQRQRDTMYRVAYAILRNDDACADAMQTAVLKAWEKRHTLRNESYFRTWLTRILINVCRRMLRRSWRFVPLEEVGEPGMQMPDPTLQMVLMRLPEQLRLPLVMSCVEGMSYQEIALALKLPETTVRGRIYRAKEQLRKELKA